MTVFWANPEQEVCISYDELITELTEREERHPVVYTEDPSEILIEILLAILADESVTLLDQEFSRETLTSLEYDEDTISTTETAPEININKPDELASKIENADDQWTLTLYTSGTTGTPSSVDQTLENLTRSVRKGDDFSNHVWSFAYNPTHLAGLQVFFQAVLNINPMVYIFESQPQQIENLIDEYGITHISATPTFYRLRLQQLSDVHHSVTRLTSGGEKFEPSLRKSLQEIFPDAEFRNVYAITEAGSLLESDGELFEIPRKYSDKLKITENNELAVHKSLLGKSMADDLNGEWYHTDDLVEYVNEDQFRFVGRGSEFVNIAGYQVNPHNIEQQINCVEEVDVAVVSSRESSVTGNILVAKIKPIDDVDPEIAKKSVENKIAELEKWKQPRVINVVENIEQTRSGKRLRGKIE